MWKIITHISKKITFGLLDKQLQYQKITVNKLKMHNKVNIFFSKCYKIKMTTVIIEEKMFLYGSFNRKINEGASEEKKSTVYEYID